MSGTPEIDNDQFAAGNTDDSGLEHSVGVFSGGSLVYGATGRPDLLGKEHTDALVRHQHTSAQRLADLLPAEAGVFPTHGFGSRSARPPSPRPPTRPSARTRRPTPC